MATPGLRARRVREVEGPAGMKHYRALGTRVFYTSGH